MAKTVDVVAGQKVASNWGNEVRDRTRQVMASKAELDAQWGTAANGSHAVTADTGVWWDRIGGAWVATGPSLAWHADYTADVGLSGTYAFYQPVSFTLPAVMDVIITVEGALGTAAGGQVNYQPALDSVLRGILSVAAPGIAVAWRLPFATSVLVPDVAAGAHLAGIGAVATGTNPYVGSFHVRVQTVAIGTYLKANLERGEGDEDG